MQCFFYPQNCITHLHVPWLLRTFKFLSPRSCPKASTTLSHIRGTPLRMLQTFLSQICCTTSTLFRCTNWDGNPEPPSRSDPFFKPTKLPPPSCLRSRPTLVVNPPSSDIVPF